MTGRKENQVVPMSSKNSNNNNFNANNQLRHRNPNKDVNPTTIEEQKTAGGNDPSRNVTVTIQEVDDDEDASEDDTPWHIRLSIRIHNQLEIWSETVPEILREWVLFGLDHYRLDIPITVSFS